MKIFNFFTRTCTVPGGSSLGAICKHREGPFVVRSDPKVAADLNRNALDIPADLESAPFVVNNLSRVVYRVYDDDLAVVFSGIDPSFSTRRLEAALIAWICEHEKLDPRAWSFYNLLTGRHFSHYQRGEYDYVQVMIRIIETPAHAVGGIPIIGSAAKWRIKKVGSLPVRCPAVVRDDFSGYISRLNDSEDSPSEGDADGEESEYGDDRDDREE